MKKPNGKKIIAAGFILLPIPLLILLYFTGKSYMAQENQGIRILPDHTYDETIVVVADRDYEPFSFADHNGNPDGYDIEVLYAAANKMKVNVEVKLLNWADCKKAIESGEADMITGLEYRQSGYPGTILSRTLINDSFVCFGKENYYSIGNLYHKKLATIVQSGCLSEFLEPYQLTKNTTCYPTYTEAMQSVISGENDYVVVRYSVGRRILAKLGEKKVHAVGPPVVNNSVCIGVYEKSPHLLEKLNSAIDELTYDGTLENLGEKWLGRYVELISFKDFLRIYSNVVLIMIGCVIVLVTVALLYIYRGKAKAIQMEQDKQLKEKELELAESRIVIMLSQIKPHFLYNALSTIAMLCEKSPEAKQATIDFAVYLRGNMDSLGENKSILFEKERRHIEVYLNLEKMRFHERLNVVYDIQATTFMLPPLTVQPIVENAVRYSVGKKEGDCTVRISTRETEVAYIIEVSDDGVGFDPKDMQDSGQTHIGINNVSKRLRAQCGGRLTIESEMGVGTTVTMIIPKQGEDYNENICCRR